MKITDFENLIRHFPYERQAFRVNKKVWLPEDRRKEDINQYDIIETVFGNADSIMISRNDLLTAKDELEIFVIKVLMWGYPTKGRGNNIENILEPEKFNSFIEQLQILIEKKNINLKEIRELLKLEGLGLSTLSKILYFKRIEIEYNPAMILDRRVINAINAETRFVDSGIEQFKELKYENGANYYEQYLAFLKELATEMKVQPDQIEMFLYEFGANLKEVRKTINNEPLNL